MSVERRKLFPLGGVALSAPGSTVPPGSAVGSAVPPPLGSGARSPAASGDGDKNDHHLEGELSHSVGDSEWI